MGSQSNESQSSQEIDTRDGLSLNEYDMSDSFIDDESNDDQDDNHDGDSDEDEDEVNNLGHPLPHHDFQSLDRSSPDNQVNHRSSESFEGRRSHVIISSDESDQGDIANSPNDTNRTSHQECLEVSISEDSGNESSVEFYGFEDDIPRVGGHPDRSVPQTYKRTRRIIIDVSD